MIKVLPHKKVIQMFILLNLIGYDDDNGVSMHELRLRVRKDLDKASRNELSDFKKATSDYHRYSLTYLAIHSNESWELNADVDKSKRHLEWLSPIVCKAINTLDLNSYYDKHIREDYEIICKDLESELQEFSIEAHLRSFWEIDFEPQEHIVIPNPLDACFRGTSFEMKDSVFSVLGPFFARNKQLVEFSGGSIKFNIIHEFSHSYYESFSRQIVIQLNDESIKNKLDIILKSACKLSHNEEGLLESYEKPSRYFEETFVRVSSVCFIDEASTSKDIINRRLENIKSNGFIFAIGVYTEIKKYKAGKSKYKTMGDLYLGAIEKCYVAASKL